MRLIGTDYERKIKQILMSYLPRYYQDSKVVNEIMRVDSKELEGVYGKIVDVFNQFFIDTATWGLDIWEKDFGISTDQSQSIEMRRARIKSKITGQGTFTREDALSLANQYSNPKDAEFIDIPGEYAFKTRINMDHLVDYEGLVEAFAEMKPAHLEHIVGFLIKISLAPRMYQRSVLELWLKQTFGIKNTRVSYKYLITASIVGFGKYWDVPSTKYLYTNGVFFDDGIETLSGLNPKGVDLYNEQADVISFNLALHLIGKIAHEITIKKSKLTQTFGYAQDMKHLKHDFIKQNLKYTEGGLIDKKLLTTAIHTIMEVGHEIISKKATVSNHFVTLPGPIHRKYDLIGNKANFIGMGAEFEPVKDYDDLYLNRGWTLDGTLTLNGDNENDFQLYLTSSATIRVIKNGVKVEEEFIY